MNKMLNLVPKKKIKNILGFDFKYFSSNENIGLSRAVNFLIDKAKTRYCLMTEPDITISEKSIINLKKGEISFRVKQHHTPSTVTSQLSAVFSSNRLEIEFDKQVHSNLH